MSGWTFAWGERDDTERSEEATWQPLAGRAVALAGVALAAWLFLFASGIFTTLGSAEGSERHDGRGVYLSEASDFGLATMYVFAGQRLWWDYDVTVEGRGGVRLRIVKSIPGRDFHVRMRDVEQTGRGRFEVVAPESGLYSFDQELVPQGVLIGGGEPGRTSYSLSWGVD